MDNDMEIEIPDISKIRRFALAIALILITLALAKVNAVDLTPFVGPFAMPAF